MFNLLQKDIHDLKKSSGMDGLNEVVLSGLDLGSESFKIQRMLSMGVLILSLTEPATGSLLPNINELKEGDVSKIYLGLVYVGFNKLMSADTGL
ncbi:MAG: hypothetical protein SH818_12885 [Saprospiraceae bacterium]|nr:hypothetical protein [Saprospiraceae bacterium]